LGHSLAELGEIHAAKTVVVFFFVSKCGGSAAARLDSKIQQMVCDAEIGLGVRARRILSGARALANSISRVAGIIVPDFGRRVEPRRVAGLHVAVRQTRNDVACVNYTIQRVRAAA
jgi:hypothetical protein